jgi:hypothetical protein|tara:strand:- start:168 stop:377 length:210 start_codon:yes stop_codon:yes gene_type:complete
MTKPSGWRHQFDIAKTLQCLFPDDTKLHLCKSIPHASMNTEPKRRMVSHALAINLKGVGIFDYGRITIR